MAQPYLCPGASMTFTDLYKGIDQPRLGRLIGPNCSGEEVDTWRLRGGRGVPKGVKCPATPWEIPQF